MSATVAIPAEIVGDTETLQRRLRALESAVVLHGVTHGVLIRDGIRSVIPKREQEFVRLADQWYALHGELHRRHIAAFHLARPERLA